MEPLSSYKPLNSVKKEEEQGQKNVAVHFRAAFAMHRG